MVWIWDMPRENDEWGADFEGFDPDSTIRGLVNYTDSPVEPETRAIFKSRTGLHKFKKLHAPPTSIYNTVDKVWRDVILNFVPADHIQFLPTRLIAKNQICEDFMLMLPFDRIMAIDKSRSDLKSFVENDHGTFIFGLRKLVLHPNCLGSFHLAKDKQMESLLLVSDELKEALSATGQDSVFYHPQDAPIAR